MSAAPLRSPHRLPLRAAGAAVRFGLSGPGRVVDALTGEADPLPPADLSRDELLSLVRAAPRAHAYLALEDGLRVFRHGAGAMVYAQQGRNVFSVGGPLGPPRDYDTLMRAFADALRRAGVHRSLVFSLSEDEVAAARTAGWSIIQAGSKPVCDPTGFSLRGRRRGDLRQMTNRAFRRFGLEVFEADATRDGPALDAVYRAWLGSRPAGHAHRLLVGTPRLRCPEGRRYFAVEGPRGIEGFCSITPGDSGAIWGIDVFARRPDAPAGAMDLLIVRVVQTLGREGVRRFSLGACPMSDEAPPDPRRDTWMRPAFRGLYRTPLGDLIFPFGSLAYFKGKFADHWEPVYLAARPNVGPWTLYVGCRMWGLFG